MQNIKTPGVYVQEISKLPASVAPAATAIPAFVGYTQKRIRDKKEILKDTPVMIRSLLEYEEIFGGPYEESFSVTLTSHPENQDETVIEIEQKEEDMSPYLMHHSLRFYFGNGGGPCYIVSVGVSGYENDPGENSIKAEDLESGLKALEMEDEPTLLVIPELVILNKENRKSLHDAMLDQCGKLKDRLAIMDVVEDENQDPLKDADRFRDNEVGMNNLKYGAAYYPSLQTTFRRFYRESSVKINDNREKVGGGPLHGNSLFELLKGANYDLVRLNIKDEELLKPNDTLTINGNKFKISTEGDESTAIQMADQIVKSVKTNDSYVVNRKKGEPVIEITLADSAEDDSLVVEFSGDSAALSITVDKIFTVELDTSLYNRIKKDLSRKTLKLYPSAAMAGIYSRVDRDKGVWRAPANVSLNYVSDPSVLLTDDEQAPLNVDADSGKSVNVIRKIHKKGTIVWGARTLAGNDNEWRYIQVRRLFIFIEESIRKATEPIVFEPNDANTWAKTKAMVENFLTGLWRDGALAGATQDEAFFVKVGLGKTMSKIDILEGRLIIEVGIASVRPAEFIILQFMHKLQES